MMASQPSATGAMPPVAPGGNHRIGVMYLGRLAEVAPAKTLFRQPLHPYTRLLLDTVPNLDMGRREREPVGGEVPNPIEPPPGCPFHPHCPYANQRCRVEVPKLRAYFGSRVACHGVEEGRLPDLPRSAVAEPVALARRSGRSRRDPPSAEDMSIYG